MVALTMQRQWRIGLGMFIADPASNASYLIRLEGIALLQRGIVVPPSWKRLIQTYLDNRSLRRNSDQR